MTLNTVTLTWDLTDLVETGLPARIVLTPTAVLTDSIDHVVILEVPKSTVFLNGVGSLPGIIACDNTQITPSGWAYTIQVISDRGRTILPPFTAFINFANGATQDLSQLVPVQNATQFQAYMPLPAGTPTSGQVPIATGIGEASAWGPVAVDPMTTLGDTIYGGTGGAMTRLPGDTSNTRKFLREQAVAGVATAPAWDSLQAGDIPALPYDAAGAAAARIARAGDTMTGQLSPAVVTLTFGATIAVNAALGNAYAVTLTSSAGTLANPTSPVDGQVIRIRVIQDATGGRTLAYGTAYDFGAAGAPTLSTAANKVDILGFEYVASLSKWCYLGSGLGF